MRRAIELAKLGEGQVSPNPLVGCVIVKNNQIISEGYHAKRGEGHAERNAILKLNEQDLEGSELYCTLEPCCHTDKLTPPCTELIKKYSFSKIFIGHLDPNPKVAGNGIKQLRDSGFKVEIGLLEKECGELIRIFKKNIETSTPYIHLKAAVSLDGKVCNANNDSKWITDESARLIAHEMRRKHDATAVGRGTLLHDDPGLTVRHVESERKKTRILFADIGKLQAGFNKYKLFKNTDLDPTIVVTHENHVNSERVLAARDLGVQFVFHSGDALDLNVMRELYQKGVFSFLMEGGTGLLTSFVKASNYDELGLFIAPFMIGNGKSFFEDSQIVPLSEIERLKLSSTRTIGDQILASYIREN